MKHLRSTGWVGKQAVVWFLACLVALAAEPAKQDGSLNEGAKAPGSEKDGQPADDGDGRGEGESVESMRRELLELGAALQRARAQLGQTQAELQSLQAENKSLHRELEQKIGAIKAVTESLAVSQTELELFRRKYEEQRLLLQTLGGQIRGENPDFEGKFAELVRALEQSESDRAQLRAQLKRTVEIAEALLPVNVEGPQGERVRAMIVSELARAREFAGVAPDAQPVGAVSGDSTLQDARVVRVNPELQLVVLDIGRVHGVQLGMPFAVIRDDRVIAQVMVVDVRDRICGAVIGAQRRKPESGDRAKIQGGRP